MNSLNDMNAFLGKKKKIGSDIHMYLLNGTKTEKK